MNKNITKNNTIEECEFHREGLVHICKEELEEMPKILRDFGIISKAIQPEPSGKEKEKDMEKPYWASSHEYDANSPDWGRYEIHLSEFQQSGLTHHFSSLSLLRSRIIRIQKQFSIK